MIHYNTDGIDAVTSEIPIVESTEIKDSSEAELMYKNEEGTISTLHLLIQR